MLDALVSRSKGVCIVCREVWGRERRALLLCGLLRLRGGGVGWFG